VSLLEISVAAGDVGPLIVLSGVADISNIGMLTGVISSRLSDSASQLMIEVSGLLAVDASATWILVLAARTLKGGGGSMVLIRPQEAVAKALGLADVDHVITIREETHLRPGPDPGDGPLSLRARPSSLKRDRSRRATNTGEGA
jgi:anti-anti-sigma factor